MEGITKNRQVKNNEFKKREWWLTIWIKWIRKRKKMNLKKLENFKSKKRKSKEKEKAKEEEINIIKNKNNENENNFNKIKEEKKILDKKIKELEKSLEYYK